MKSIRTAAVYLLAGLLGGFALAALWSDDADDIAVARVADGAALERRLAALEDRIDAVIVDNARLAAALQRLDDVVAVAAEPAGADSQSAAVAANATDDGRQPFVTQTTEGAATQPGGPLQRLRERDRNLAERLTDAGFSASDAQLIETRIEELRVEAMQSRYEALRNGESPDALRGGLADGTSALRSELGDDQYERFLEATGRPTQVNVTSVLARSAAQTAGLQDGDAIVAYDGARVFDIRDLNRVLLEGEPGEPVVVDVVRDGQPMQVVMPRGPLGIASGFTRRGPR